MLDPARHPLPWRIEVVGLAALSWRGQGVIIWGQTPDGLRPHAVGAGEISAAGRSESQVVVRPLPCPAARSGELADRRRPAMINELARNRVCESLAAMMGSSDGFSSPPGDLSRSAGPAAVSGAQARGRNHRHSDRPDHRAIHRISGRARAARSGARSASSSKWPARCWKSKVGWCCPTATRRSRPWPIRARSWSTGCWNTRSTRTRPACSKSAAAAWQDHFARAADDLPPRVRDLAAEEIREVELWDLVSAFGRIVRDSQAVRPSNIVYDDTPIHVYMAEIQARLLQQGQLAFRELFRPGMHRSALVGIFLAVLELVRHDRVRTEQNELFGEIWILPGESAAAPLDAAAVDNYDHGQRRPPQPERNATSERTATDRGTQ